MSIQQRISIATNTAKFGRQALLRSSSTATASPGPGPGPSSPSWANNAALPGGFNADGLREWAVLTDFGADGYEQLKSQEMRRRRRHMEDEDDTKLPYVDLFSQKVSNECSEYLARHPSPSDLLGRAFFGSNVFIGEKIASLSMNAALSLFPNDATTLPTHFKANDQYLHWKVTMKAPLEMICSWELKALNFKGVTMLAYDPSLRKAYHGNCIDVAEGEIDGFIPEMAVQMHVKYAEILLSGLVNELEKDCKK